MEENNILIPTNKYQTSITEELLSKYPDEVREQFMEFISTVPFIQNLISPSRPNIKDLPRDEYGRAIIDISNPPVFEDADYFRQPALFFLKNGCYTLLRPNSNPNSEYRKFWDREIDRIYNGMLRKSDGMWIPGYMYWFLNYCPMMINEYQEGKKKAIRKEGFAYFFEGIWLRYWYLYYAREGGHHATELAKRGAAKSYSLAAIMSHNLILGESEESKKRTITVLTAYQKEYLKDDKDGTLSKFVPILSHLSNNTPFPRLMLKQSSNEMTWQMGYKDEYGRPQGSLNQVMGVSAKDDSDKLRGKRGWILFEEFGNFNGLLELYDVTRKSVEDGDYTFALMYLLGTSNNKEANFQSAKTLLYAPSSYNIQEVKNVYDKKGQGRDYFGFFFPAYMNRAGCYNKDGISDVVKALLQILYNRYKAKYGADPTSVLRVIAEDPITPAEAIIKVKDAFFNVQALNDRAQQLDTNPNLYDDVYVGSLYINKKGEVDFEPTNDIPIRKFPVDNDTRGALEIYTMPEKDKSGKVFSERYICSVDPVDNDMAESSSLYSCFVFDLFTDTIVAEFTGRNPYANDNFEITRLLCLFYNAKCMYEAHPYNQEVRLPNGTTKLWGDIKIGDKLFAPNGKIVEVIDIPMDGEDDIYKITLDDGRTIEASSNHIWKVSKCNYKGYYELTTKNMYNIGVKNKYNQTNFFLPESGAVEYSHKDVPIDPYTLGLLIAEGAFTKFHKNKYENFKRRIIQFSSSKDDAEFYRTVIPYNMKYIGTKGCSYHLYIDDIDKKLESLGLLHHNSYNKFIPKLYLYNDYNTRLELLKGLMDGDGCAVSQGASVFVTTSKQLNDDIKLLCRSLGIKCKNNKGKKSGIQNIGKRYCRCTESYRVSIASNIIIFKLPRKVKKQHIYTPYSRGSKASAYLYKTAIKSIEYVGVKKCKCITVNSKDGLYLIGDYVTTHNCNKKGLFAYFQTRKSTHLLAETPEYLRDKMMIKYKSFGSNAYGINANSAINNYANGLLKDWFNKLVPITIKDDNGEENVVQLPLLYTLKTRALIEEAIQFNPEINVDRIRAMGMVMLYRQEYIIKYGDTLNKESREEVRKDDPSNDPFFKKNYDNRWYSNKTIV